VHKFLFLILSLSFVSCSVLTQIEGVKTKQPGFTVVWSKNNDPAHQTGNMPIALNSPVIHEGILYAGHNDGHMQAFQLENGRKIWSKYDDSDYHSKPVVYKDWVIYGTAKGRIFSRHLLTGKSQYIVDLGSSIETQGVIYKDRVIFQTRNHKVFCLDVTTGKILWTYKRSVPYLTTVQRASKPLIFKNRVYIGFADGSLAAFSLEEGVILWERKLSTGSKFVDVDSSPILFNSRLFAGSINGELVMIEPNSGEILRRFPYKISRSPLVHGGKLYVSTIFGEILKLDKNLMEESKVMINKSVLSSIIPWKGGLAVSSVKKEILLLSQDDLSIQSTFDLGHAYSGVLGELEVGENYLAAISSRNRLYIFK